MKTTILDLQKEKELLEKELQNYITEIFSSVEKDAKIEVVNLDIVLSPEHSPYKAEVNIKLGINKI